MVWRSLYLWSHHSNSEPFTYLVWYANISLHFCLHVTLGSHVRLLASASMLTSDHPVGLHIGGVLTLRCCSLKVQRHYYGILNVCLYGNMLQDHIINAPVIFPMVCMQQSWVKIKVYFVAYFQHIIVFEVLYRWTSIRGRAHSRFVDTWLSDVSVSS